MQLTRRAFLLLLVLALAINPARCAFTASTVWEVRTAGLDDFNAASAVVAVGGSGYSVNDVLTVVGGTSTTAATFTVTAVSIGVVTTVSLTNAGHYTVLPANPVSTTGGGGTLATLTITWNLGGNGGGFDAGVAGFPTDGAATSATGTAPVFTSASYNFVAGDVGAWIYIKSGTNWTPGWYQIASVASNAATLNATIGQAVLAAGTPTTVAGVATTASPTSATWGIDYSQSGTAQISFTDMVIDGTTNTKFTSAGHPVGKNFVGNIISVTAGTGFTVQRVAIVSTSGTTATCDKSLGTLSSTGGTGKLGGAFASPGAASALGIASNKTWVKTGTYSITSASTNVAAGCVSNTVGVNWEGYGSVRGDLGTAPILQASGISTATIFATLTGGTPVIRNITVDGASLTSIQGFSLARRGTHYVLKATNCTNIGINGTSADAILIKCRVTNCTGGTGAFVVTSSTAFDCIADANTVTGFSGSGQGEQYIHCISRGNTGASSDGFLVSSESSIINCTSYGNGRDGFRLGAEAGYLANNVAEGNSGYGYRNGVGAAPNYVLDNCAGYNNTSGNIDTATITGQVLNFIAYTATAFVSSTNFALNSNNPGGAQLRAAGIPGTFPDGLTTGYLDIGAAQHANPTLATGYSAKLRRLWNVDVFDAAERRHAPARPPYQDTRTYGAGILSAMAMAGILLLARRA